MNIQWLLIGLLIFGLWATTFGLRLLFKAGYVEKLRTGIWKPTQLDEKNFPGKSGYYYNKYARGIESLVMGLLALGYSIYALFIH